jgi:hypothetical protein
MKKNGEDDNEPLVHRHFLIMNEKKKGKKMTTYYVVANEKDKQENYDKDCHHLLIFYCSALRNESKE